VNHAGWAPSVTFSTLPPRPSGEPHAGYAHRDQYAPLTRPGTGARGRGSGQAAGRPDQDHPGVTGRPGRLAGQRGAVHRRAGRAPRAGGRRGSRPADQRRSDLERLADEHGTAVAYPTLRTYVSNRRGPWNHPGQSGWPARNSRQKPSAPQCAPTGRTLMKPASTRTKEAGNYGHEEMRSITSPIASGSQSRFRSRSSDCSARSRPRNLGRRPSLPGSASSATLTPFPQTQAGQPWPEGVHATHRSRRRCLGHLFSPMPHSRHCPPRQPAAPSARPRSVSSAP